MSVQRFKWTRESAIEYLASNPNFSSNKPLDHWSTSELKRRASVFKRAEQAGQEVPSREKQRGHERVRHFFAKSNKLEQWRVDRKRRDINQSDLLEMYKQASKKKGTSAHTEVMIIIHGVSNYKPARGTIATDGTTTPVVASDMNTLKEEIDEMTDIYEFAESLTLGQIEWSEIHWISFAFPNE